MCNLCKVRVDVLGDVEIWGPDGSVVVAPSVRRLLARLVIARGAVVSDDELIDCLWDSAPCSACKTLHGYVHRARKVLGPNAVERVGIGYRLTGVDTDLVEMEQAYQRGRALAASGEQPSAGEEFDVARRRFRSLPVRELAGINAESFQREMQEVQRRLDEEFFGAKIRAGQGPTVIAELDAHLTRDPTREVAWCQLVEALIMAGRRADALAAVGRARRALALELGISPGPALLALERAAVADDPPLTVTPKASWRGLPGEIRGSRRRRAVGGSRS